MLFDELKHGIDEFYKRLKVDNPFFSKAMDGTLAPEQLSVFLDNLAMVMEGNIVNTRFAEEESRKRGLTNLAEYFRKKYDEEHGHIAWANDDASVLRGWSPNSALKVDSVRAAQNARNWVEYNRTNIKKDPALFLVHIIFGEYFTVLSGPEFTKSVMERCGIPKKALRNLVHHMEIDKDHVFEFGEELEGLIDSKVYHKTFHVVLNRSMRLYSDFCTAVGSCRSEEEQSYERAS